MEDAAKTRIDDRKELLKQALVDIAERLAITIHYEDLQKGEIQTSSGHCRYKGDLHVLLDRNDEITKQIEVLVKVLRNIDLEGIFLNPAVRNLLYPIMEESDK